MVFDNQLLLDGGMPELPPPPHTRIAQVQAPIVQAPIDDGPLGADQMFFGLPPLDPDTPTNHALDTTNESDAPPPLMGTDDPFSVVADVARNALAGGSAAPQTTYVPVVSGGGSAGGGSGLMFALLAVALIGGVAWWYFKKGKGSNAGAN